ncbi:hypothetical protein [Pseudoalteromonas sp. Ld20]|uniref:hypothetical protein n=1 Tax=Pseudoalteromonas sp. Ld20 TaxID=649165 RepID=UPI00386DBF3F
MGDIKVIKIEHYNFKASAKELFEKLADNEEFDCDDDESFKYYFKDFEEYYNDGLTKVYYNQEIEPDGDNCFTINNEVLFYSVFNGCLCFDSGEYYRCCENIERYFEDFRNEGAIIRSGYDAFLNIIHEDLRLIDTEEIYILEVNSY